MKRVTNELMRVMKELKELVKVMNELKVGPSEDLPNPFYGISVRKFISSFELIKMS